jgi:DNA-binding response OmpR family regulator
MVEGQTIRVVGILNSTEDVIEILQEFLQGEDYATIAAFIPDFKRGRRDLAAWLAQLPPAPIIYDLPPPYEQNWRFFQSVRAQEAARRHRFILTTTNKRVLEEVAGPVEAIEFIGKPFDLEELLRAVEAAFGEIVREQTTCARE